MFKRFFLVVALLFTFFLLSPKDSYAQNTFSCEWRLTACVVKPGDSCLPTYYPDDSVCAGKASGVCTATIGQPCIGGSTLPTPTPTPLGPLDLGATYTCAWTGSACVVRTSNCSTPSNADCNFASESLCSHGVSRSCGEVFVAVTPEKGTWFSRDFLEWYPLVYDTDASPETDIYGERYTAAQVEWIIYGWWAFNLNRILPRQITSCILSNWGNTVATDACLVTAITELLITDASTNIPPPALADDAANKSLITSIIEPRPISGINYIREKLSVVPQAQAQGFGFNNLGIAQDLWRVSRDFAFALMILVIIILAFMIMFRMKTSPQTAISVQTAIPRVFVTILLIAFSYAIAGFLVDLVYVVIGIFATMFEQTGLTDRSTVQLYNFMIAGPENDGLWQIFSDFMFVFPIALFLAIQAAVTGLFASLVAGIGSFLIILLIWILGYIIALWIWFRTIWTMLKALLGVAVSIILGPFQILLGSLGVAGTGFGAWVKGLLANLMIFAVVGPIVIFATLFLYLSFGEHTTLQGILDAWVTFREVGISTDSAPEFWQPPLLGSGNYLPIIFLFMSLGLISSIPKISDAIKGFISGRPISMGSAVGEALGPVGTVGGFASTSYLHGVAVPTLQGGNYPTGMRWMGRGLSRIGVTPQGLGNTLERLARRR